MINNIIDQLKRDEGFLAHVYLDKFGYRTIGYGHNLDANPMPGLFYVNEAQATQILGRDVERISMSLQQKLPWVTTLDDARHGVLQNMAFNMGVLGLLDFHHMLSAMVTEDWATAKAEGEDSKWFSQVGDRAVRLMAQLETGEWQ